MSYPHQDLGYRVGGPSPYGEGPYKEKNTAPQATPYLFTYMSSPTREQLDFSTIDPRSLDTRYKLLSASPPLGSAKGTPTPLAASRPLFTRPFPHPETNRVRVAGKRMPIASHDWIFIHGKSSK